MQVSARVLPRKCIGERLFKKKDVLSTLLGTSCAGVGPTTDLRPCKSILNPLHYEMWYLGAGLRKGIKKGVFPL